MSGLPRGSIVVPFGGSYIESYKVIPNKELVWSLWVLTSVLIHARGIQSLSRQALPGTCAQRNANDSYG